MLIRTAQNRQSTERWDEYMTATFQRNWVWVRSFSRTLCRLTTPAKGCCKSQLNAEKFTPLCMCGLIVPTDWSRTKGVGSTKQRKGAKVCCESQVNTEKFTPPCMCGLIVPTDWSRTGEVGSTRWWSRRSRPAS